MSLYLKYRPTKVDELDLENVRNSLLDILKSGKLSHAYLFDGPRGSGKTSSARILAKVVNCKNNTDGFSEPCGKCPSCLAISNSSAVDLVEIDAASNRGIDDIRELKQKIRLAPAQLTKKIYIVDEVHMLTTEAFNALLKTLEEPPSHSIFVLCTTEFHKLPETIVSRCTRIPFRKATNQEMLRSLQRVVVAEKINVNQDALEFLAGAVDGSFRDGVKVLEQTVKGQDEVTVERIQEILYGVSGFNPKDFVHAILKKNVDLALGVVQEVGKSGMDMSYFLKSSMELIRGGLLAKYGVGQNSLSFEVGDDGLELIKIMDETAKNLKGAVLPHLLVEVMVLDWCGTFDLGDEGGGGLTAEKDKSKKDGESRNNKKTRTKKSVEKTNVSLLSMGEMDLKRDWRNLIGKIGDDDLSLEALLSHARPISLVNSELVVEVGYEFHKQQLETERFMRKMEELLDSTFQEPVKLRYELVRVEIKNRSSNLSELDAGDKIGGSETDDELISAAEKIFSN